MTRGAPDWSKVVLLRALDSEGELHDVLVDSAGRLVMLAYGSIGISGSVDVSQLDSHRTIQGTDGETLHTIAVDAEGRIMMVPYGVVTVDGGVDVTQTDSHRTIQGTDGANLHTIAVDAAGRIVMVPYGVLTVDGAVDVTQVDSRREVLGADGATLRTIVVDALGRIVMVPKGKYGATYLDLAVDVSGNLICLVKGSDGTNLQTIKTDSAGRMLTVIRDPVSDNYAAITSDGYLGAILRGASDVSLELELWTRFRAVEGTSALDYSGNGHTGTPKKSSSAAAVYGDGVVGDCIVLDGADNVVDYGTSAVFNFTTGPFTVELWLKVSAVSVTSFVVNRGTALANGWGLFLDSVGRVFFLTSQAAAYQQSYTTQQVDDGAWHHVVAVRSGTSVKLYIDGVDRTTTSASHTDPVTCVTGLFLGGSSLTAGELAGSFDEVRIYTRALTASEVLWRYRRTRVTEDSRYRALAVDPEGRLEVNMADLPYKRQVLESGSTVYASGGNHNLQSALVPEGEMYVITAAVCYVDAAAANSIDIGIYDGVQNCIVAYEYGAGVIWRAVIHGQLVLQSGDRLNFAAGHAATAYSLYWCINGYALESD